MSWEIVIQDLPRSAATVDEIPDDFEPRPLAPRSDILDAIKAAFPGADFSDPSSISVQTPSYSIELSLGDEDPVQSVMLHVRGDESAVAPIAAFIESLGARALDMWSGGFFDRAAAVESIRAFGEYRDGLR